MATILSRARQASGMSLQDMSKKLGIGSSCLAKREKGQTKIDLSFLIRYIACLDNLGQSLVTEALTSFFTSDYNLNHADNIEEV